jgi:hypothetical protein
MTVGEVLLALQLVQFTGPDQQMIVINPQTVVNFRSPRGTDHFSAGTKCLIFTSDAKYIPVMESCDKVRELLENGKH